MDISANDTDFPVLIAGGGLVGLSTALFLGRHGIRSLVIERLAEGSALPRAAHFHLRTVELFREAGIEAEVLRHSEEEFLPDGAIVVMESLAGRRLEDLIANLNEGVEAISPCRRLFISQPHLEPILWRHAQELGACMLAGYEVEDVRQDGTGVYVAARNSQTGARRSFSGRYLVGADGARSRVRDALGIRLEGRDAFSHSMTIYFDADLSPYVGGKPLSVIYVANRRLRGIFRLDRNCRSGFLIVNMFGDPASDPDAANPAKDVSEGRLIELVRLGAGVPSLDVRITGVTRWRATAQVAERYGTQRIFLAGDSAHLMPPTGGFGGNTGIHDAHNLAWKLACVLKGQARADLLATYDGERRPIGELTVQQAYARYVVRVAPHLGGLTPPPLVPDENLEIGYLYDSQAKSAARGSGLHEDPKSSMGRPGARAAHVWLRRGTHRLSSLDLYGTSFVLLAGPRADEWCAAARSAAEPFAPFDLACYRVGCDVDDADRQLLDAYGLTPTGAALVRPDGFVCWRAVAMASDPIGALVEAFKAAMVFPRREACPRTFGRT